MSDGMNKYWIRGFEIDKNVLTKELQFYLGPQAMVRPFTRQGIEGFLISTPGPCITDEQIDDICQKSRQEIQKQVEARWKAEGHQQEASKTLKRPINAPIVISLASSTSEMFKPLESIRSRDSSQHSRKRRDDDYDDRGYGYDYERDDTGRGSRWEGEKRRRSPRGDYGGDSRRRR